MKKIILLACAITLVGAGCAKLPKAQNNNQAGQDNQAVAPVVEKKTRPPEVNIPTEEINQFEELFKTKSAEAGFKIYYPTFIPETLKLNTERLIVNDISGKFKVVTYNLSDTANSLSSFIHIQEQIEGMELDPNIPKQAEAVYLKGYIKNIQTDDGQYYVLLFIKDDNTFIRMSAKTEVIDPDTLSKIAESMK